VKLCGSPSWELRTDDGARLHFLLYIRDVAALEVPADADAPPLLTGLPPRRSPVRDGDERRQAGRDWAEWWQELLDVELRERASADAGAPSFWAWAEDLARIWDAPDFWSIADRRALREVTVALHPEATRWVDAGPRAPDRLQRRGFFRWEWVRDTAESVATEHGVSPGAVRGSVTVLDVEGVWWRRVAPGAVLCSTAATGAPLTATTVLREAFESGLR
jgi:hypothetical protein